MSWFRRNLKWILLVGLLGYLAEWCISRGWTWMP
jgi:hypothetical protein